MVAVRGACGATQRRATATGRRSLTFNIAAPDLVAEVIVTPQFRGPPNSGNGGYVCGLLAGGLGASVVTGVLRAPIALDTPLRVVRRNGIARLTGLDGQLIAEARPGDPADFPIPPAPPTLAEAEVAGRGFVGLSGPFHPVCFTCADALEEGYGLRVFVGRLHAGEPGLVAGLWRVHANFAGPDGVARLDAVWAALDCPGSVAWVDQGGGAGLLGTMTCEILRRPAAGETCIVTAWPVQASGRKRVAGTALFSATGELLARSQQIWIGRPIAD